MLRETIIFLTVVSLALVISGASSARTGDANESASNVESNIVFQDTPGARCTRLSWKDMKQPRERRTFGWRCGRSRPRQGPYLVNTAPKVDLKPSVADITLSCKNGETSASCKTDPCQLVTLKAITSDPESDSIFYTFGTTGGRIIGDGTEVVWNLNGVEPGRYTATVEVDDGCGCIAFASTNVTVAACSDCK